MSRYIDADALKEQCFKFANDVSRSAMAFVQGQINTAPTADVVEVVRCKDCQHRYVPCRCALWYGTAHGKEYFVERGEDFYCSLGERNVDDEN